MICATLTSRLGGELCVIPVRCKAADRTIGPSKVGAVRRSRNPIQLPNTAQPSSEMASPAPKSTGNPTGFPPTLAPCTMLNQNAISVMVNTMRRLWAKMIGAAFAPLASPTSIISLNPPGMPAK